MKIKELMECLGHLNPELEIIIQKDSEGNDYSPLSDSFVGYYIANSTYSGECHTFTQFDSEDKEEMEEWESIKIEGKKVLILAPIN